MRQQLSSEYPSNSTFELFDNKLDVWVGLFDELLTRGLLNKMLDQQNEFLFILRLHLFEVVHKKTRQI